MKSWQELIVLGCILVAFHGSRGTVAMAQVTFAVDVMAESTLAYLSMPVRLTVHNGSAEDLAIQFLGLSVTGHVRVDVTNTKTGEKERTCGVQFDRASIPEEDFRKLPVDSTLVMMADLRSVSCARDSLSRMQYWPVGRYRATISWIYDPLGRAVVNDSPYLVDTIEFTVIDGTEVEVAAREAYLRGAGLRSYSAPGPSVKALWQMIARHGDSPYGEPAAQMMANLVQWDRKRLPRSIAWENFAATLIRFWPDSARTSTIIVNTIAAMNPVEKESFLRYYCKTEPDSPVGRTAKRHLEGE